MLTDIHTQDPDVRRKGRILAVVLLGLMAGIVALSFFNVLREQFWFLPTNGLVLAGILGLFLLNARGYVTAAGVLSAVLIIFAAMFLLSEENFARTYIVMCIPVFILSFLVRPWSGVVVAVGVIGGTLALGSVPTNLLALISLAVVTVIVYLFAESLERALEDRRYQALHDSLTDLPNRALFLDRLQHAIDRSARNGSCNAVLYMDIDGFKVINDSLGHDIGDRLLIQFGRRALGCLRPGDTAARLGGDEFALLLENLPRVNDAVQIAERVTRESEETFDLDGHQVTVSASIGITYSSRGDQPSELLRDADLAMYEAKRENKLHKVFHANMHAQSLKRLEVENELRQSIEKNDFEVHYQPKVSLGSGKVSGMEALVRWAHPVRGLMMPADFIAIAEETGLIIPLGRMVLEESCCRASEWLRLREFSDGLTVSVNLSVRQFQHPELVPDVAHALKESGLEACNLQLEVTESVMMEEGGEADRILRALKELGVGIAMDDFGKGYSSLNYLRNFPIDILKIDRSFVSGFGKDLEEDAIVRLMVDLAHTLGLHVIAEGVETAEQLAQLEAAGCDSGQGYYFSKPLPGSDARALLITGFSIR